MIPNAPQTTITFTIPLYFPPLHKGGSGRASHFTQMRGSGRAFTFTQMRGSGRSNPLKRGS